MAHLGQAYSFRVINKNSSGALANGTVTAALLRNGVASGETVTVSNQSTGRYLISATIPSGWTLEDIAQLEVTVDGVPSLIWGEKVVARPATTDQATTLTDRITGTIRTAAEDVTAETAQTAAIRNGLATAANLDDAETAVLAAIDDIQSNALTGPYTRTITVVDDDTDSPIELARVRLYRTGESESKLTNTSGVATFTVEAATWSYAITASGYAGANGTIAVSADGSNTIRLVPNSITPPADPALATLPVLTLNEVGAAESGVTVYCRLVSVPSSSTGISFDGASQSAISDDDGNANLIVVKGATYEIRRGNSQVWHKRVMTSSDVQTPMSFIGADPA